MQDWPLTAECKRRLMHFAGWLSGPASAFMLTLTGFLGPPDIRVQQFSSFGEIRAEESSIFIYKAPGAWCSAIRG